MGSGSEGRLGHGCNLINDQIIVNAVLLMKMKCEQALLALKVHLQILFDIKKKSYVGTLSLYIKVSKTEI